MLLAALTGLSSMNCTPQSALPPSMPISLGPMTPHPSIGTAPSSSFDPAHMRGIARPPGPTSQPAAGREWRHIVLHHTASEQGSVETIHESHLQRKDAQGNNWMGIGYHFVIGNGQGMRDGAIEPTFRWREQLHGAHAGSSEYNDHGIGIVLVGNFEENPPTSAQLAAVKQLVGSLKVAHGISSNNVVGHGDVKATACPGRHFPLDEISQASPGTSFGGALNAPLDLARTERIRN